VVGVSNRPMDKKEDQETKVMTKDTEFILKTKVLKIAQQKAW